jgi:protein SCO1/2
MQRPSRITELAVWGLLALTVVVIVAAFVRERSRGPAPATLPVLFPAPSFSLTNQGGHLMSTRELAGKVWVADVIFTTCGGPCPRMTEFMSGLQSAVCGLVCSL